MAGATMTVPSSQRVQMQGILTNGGAAGTLLTIFFFPAFIAAGDSVFIRFYKHYFNLDQFQSQLINFAFYGAYCLGALGFFAKVLLIVKTLQENGATSVV